MHTLRVGLILLIGSIGAAAETVDFSGLGNGKGWNDGAYYTGYVTLRFQGTNYAALCIDALHETRGTSWNAIYVPLSDTVGISSVMQAYFGTSDPAVYLPRLSSDASGYLMLRGVGEDVTANNEIQHNVWARFAPDRFDDTCLLRPYSGSMDTFGLIVDANYAHGGTLEQAFLVDSPSGGRAEAPEPASALLIGTALVGISLLLKRRRAMLVGGSKAESKPAQQER